MEYGALKTNLYIEPGNDMRIVFDADNITNTLRFEGNGAENNNFLAQFNKSFRNQLEMEEYGEYLSTHIDKLTAGRARSLNAEDYYAIVKQEKEAESSYLETGEGQINRKLYSQIWKDIHYHYLTKLYAWFGLTPELSKEGREAAAAKFFSSPTFNYSDYHRNTSPVFLNALRAYAHYEFGVYPDQKDVKSFYDIIGNKLGGYDKLFLQSELLLEVYDKTRDPQLGKLKFEQFEKDAVLFPELTRALKEKYDVELNTLQKEQAPDFQMVLSDGTIVSLKDYRGKVVYLSFWASWCAPCLKGFEKYEALRRQLQAEGVVVLNVSIDESADKYQNALRQRTIVGTNAQPMDLAGTKLLYTLSAIPSYYIIDKSGNFAYLPEEKGRDILGTFRKLIGNE